MIYGTALCLGDSLTEGARCRIGYPEALAALLTARSRGTEWASLNHGISGQTTLQILRRTPGAVGQLLSQPGAKVAVICAGTNDSKGATRDRPDDLWLTLYRQIAHWPLRHLVPTVLCTLPTVAAEMPDYGPQAPAWIAGANALIRDLAASLRQPRADGRAVPVHVCELHDLPLEVLVDGVHLTEEGYREVARRVADTILPVEARGWT